MHAEAPLLREATELFGHMTRDTDPGWIVLSVIGAAAEQIEGSVLPDDDGFWPRLREMDLPFFADATHLSCKSPWVHSFKWSFIGFTQLDSILSKSEQLRMTLGELLSNIE